MREFNKFIVLPTFGLSKAKQPVADIGKHLSAEVAEASYSSKNGENDDEIPVLYIRGYQIKGVNWLL